ncbi:class I SAM-dependent methyltransferase [Streptomyces sp. NPDC002845]
MANRPPTAPQAPRAHSFNTAAAQYAKNRPSYPPELLTTLEHLAARPLTGARTIDVGAGTGIATTLLHHHGANVLSDPGEVQARTLAAPAKGPSSSATRTFVRHAESTHRTTRERTRTSPDPLAVDPGDGMTAQFRQTLPTVPIVRGDGNALPLADTSADFITYAQSWHWTDPTRSTPEALRVLRPGGALALWWNTDALDVPWIAEAATRIHRFLGVDAAAEKNCSGAQAALADTAGQLDFTRRQIRWSRRVPLDTHLANIASHSAFLVLGEENTSTFFTEERNHLLTLFPDGFIEEVYDVDLLVAIRP